MTAFLALWLWAAPAAEPASVDLARPPVVGPMRPYVLPPRESFSLANGLEVVVVRDPRFPLVTARLAFRAGSSAIPPAQAGLAEALAGLMTEGTKRRSAKEISDEAEEYGGEIAARASPDAIIVESSCLAERAEAMASLLAEVTRWPSFPPREVALRRKNMQEELNLSRADPDFLAEVAFHRKLFKEHPYAVTAPTDASIAALSRAAVSRAHKRLITPRRAVLVLVGDMDAARARALAEGHFGSWRGPPGPDEAPAVANVVEPRRVFLVDRPGSVQTALLMGNLAVREDHPLYFDLLVANQVLGGSFSSRLVQDVRETKGYTYRIGSRLAGLMTAAVFRVRTPVRNDVTGPALEAIFGHLRRLRREAATAEEIEKAKSFLGGSFARNHETQEGVADTVLRQKLHRLPDDFFDHYVQRVQGVTPQSALRAAQTFIRPDEMTLVAVGEAKVVSQALAKFSSLPVVPVDQDGF